MTREKRVLVPQDDTHKQTINDVYNIYKTSYSKCYDEEEDMFFSDVMHYLEQQSTSTLSEADTILKYQVDDPKLLDALDQIPTWDSELPQTYGVNIGASLTCDEDIDKTPLTHLKTMGIDMIEYIKLRIGYNYLRSNLSNTQRFDGDKYTKAICPGLNNGFEDPIILRMLHMQYITRDNYMKWTERSRRKDHQSMSNPRASQLAPKKLLSSLSTKDDEKISIMNSDKSNMKYINSYDSPEDKDSQTERNTLPHLNENEKQHIIMLTQYEVTDQEFPDDIEIFWPGKRDLEHDYVYFQNAVSDNILHQKFIKKYKSGKVDLLDEICKKEQKEYYKETPCIKQDHHNKQKQIEVEPQKCCWQKYKEKFKDYKITQEVTLSLFDNMIKEKTKLEDLNLCCIIKKLQEIHKDQPEDVNKEGEIIWKDIVVVRTKSTEYTASEQEVNVLINESSDLQKESERSEQSLVLEEEEENEVEEEDESEEEVLPEFRSMIYVTKVYPEPGEAYRKDKCRLENNFGDTLQEKKFKRISKGCSGYSMEDYKKPTLPVCNFKIPLGRSGECESVIEQTRSLTSLPNHSVNPDEMVTFHTNWYNYPYAEMIDIIFHRHHKGYIYMTDVFEITPDTLQEVNRIFSKTGKFSEIEAKKNIINANTCDIHLCSQQINNQIQCKITNERQSQNRASLSSMTKDNIKDKKDISPAKFIHFSTQSGGDSTSRLNKCALRIKNLDIEGEMSESSEPVSIESVALNTKDDLEVKYYVERFKSTQNSSIYFDSHNSEDNNMYTVKINCKENEEVEDKNNLQEDDQSDIANFIKNFPFEKETNIEINQDCCFEEETQEPLDVINTDPTDLLSEKSFSNSQDCSIHDENSINSKDSHKLEDIKGFLRNFDICCDDDLSNVSLRDDTSPKINHCITGEFIDVIIGKRKSIVQELRSTFPLVYLFLNIKTNFTQLNISGNLHKYHNHFKSLDKEYKKILNHYKIKDKKRVNKTCLTDNIPHQYYIYEEILGKRILEEEVLGMIVQYPPVRHIFIRETFQDIGMNLSFFLLPFIENDRSNIFYDNPEKFDVNKIRRAVCVFIRNYRTQHDYEKFMSDMFLLHYFENREYFKIKDLIMRDKNWEEIYKTPREMTDINNDDKTITINFKDATLKKCYGYSYIIYYIIQQFNINYYNNNTFKTFLDPELSPSNAKSITCSQMEKLVFTHAQESGLQKVLVKIDNDITRIMKMAWQCEILGIVKCKININHIKNMYRNEMGNYFHTFFPNNFEITLEESSITPDNKIFQNKNYLWIYNRKHNFWYNNEYNHKEKATKQFLTECRLYKVEKLFTILLLKSLLTYYDYRLHG